MLIDCVFSFHLKAYQTFEVLCKIGSKHDLSAGLIIGGKVGPLHFNPQSSISLYSVKVFVTSLLTQPLLFVIGPKT